jgi:hypothetical protein
MEDEKKKAEDDKKKVSKNSLKSIITLRKGKRPNIIVTKIY